MAKGKRNASGGPAGERHELTPGDLLASVPVVNRAVDQQRGPDGTLLLSIPLKRPWFMVPPISWILPLSTHRRVGLDTIGSEVLDLCDGERTVEGVIEKFMADHKLTFREAQLSVTTFLRQLMRRGVVVLVGRKGNR